MENWHIRATKSPLLVVALLALVAAPSICGQDMSAEEILGLAQRGFRNQWEAGWQILHPQSA